jgi:putative phosphoesterase
MKLMFISDIHGSGYHFKRVMDCISMEKPDFVCLLGDLLYHGPRNPLPEGYDPEFVIEGLNGMKESIISVRGNCDTEVDQMVLEFPILADYTIILSDNRRLFLTHGHHYNGSNMPKLTKGDAVIHGHTHIPSAVIVDGIYVLSPGSISLPKEGTPNSYGILEEDLFVVKDMEGNPYLTHKL